MSDLDLLETPRLVLSGWRRDQLDDLVRLHGDPRVSAYLSASGEPWTREQAATALESYVSLFEDRRMGKLRVRRKHDGVLLGRAGFGTYGESEVPELGYALFRDFWGFGYASEAARALRDWIFAETAWDYFLGAADVRNAASRRVLRGIGMIETHMKEEDGAMLQFHIYERPKA